VLLDTQKEIKRASLLQSNITAELYFRRIYLLSTA